jgi:hypothetical protein
MKVTITFESDVSDLDVSALQPFVDAIAEAEAADAEFVFESDSESEVVIYTDSEEAEGEEAEGEEAEGEEAEVEADEQTDQ